MGIYQDTSPQEIVAHFGVEMEALYGSETYIPRNEANIRERIGVSFVAKQMKEMWHIEMKKASIIVDYDENFNFSLVRVILPDDTLCQKLKENGKNELNCTQIATLDEVMEHFGIKQEKSNICCFIQNEDKECQRRFLAAWKRKKVRIIVDYDADFDFILMRIISLR